MDWTLLHQKGRLACPKQPLPERRYWIGVLRHTHSPEQELRESDFLWILGHSKITIAQTAAQYSLKNPGVDFELKAREVLTPSTKMKELNEFNDNLVILQAVERSTRVPLQPIINRQLPSQAVQDSSATSTAAKQPSLTLLNTPQKRSGSIVRMTAAMATPTYKTAPFSPLRTSAVHPSSTNDHPSLPHTSMLSPSVNSLAASIASTSPVTAPFSGYDVMPPMTSPLGSAPRPDIMNEHRLSPLPMPSHPTAEPEEDPLVSAPTMDPDSQPADSQPAFDPSDVFAEDSESQMRTGIEERPAFDCIRTLIEEQNPELLETGVTHARKVLDALKDTFSKHGNNEEARTWMNAIDKLRSQAERKKTVVGVVGNTGAGKSSVINAMLDEERLVPTNCMRACTAVVTELSWNNSNDPTEKYRAEIEFINHADWEKELSVLLKEFLNEEGKVLREISDQNSEAGVAWAKFHAVYPRITQNMLADYTVEKLMADRSVQKVLGTTKRIRESDPKPFYSELQRYVDSKEKATGKGSREKNLQAGMEYWPLIKVVKIYTKSPALSTGAVIVDLPGVHDSNAARSAVAQGYMKQCTGLWIVAPINRAVDDKAAKTLLGDSFKRQLKYDGGFSSVTFICSKTDDISVTEAEESLGLEDQISGLRDEERKHNLGVETLERKIKDLKESKAVYGEAYESAVDAMEAWDKLRDQLIKGETVFAPVENRSKRKRKSPSLESRKRPRSGYDSDDGFIVPDDWSKTNSDTDSDSDSESSEPPRRPLTSQEIEDKLEELRDTKNNARRQRNQLQQQIKDTVKELEEVEKKLANVQAEINAICIAGRNQYSKSAIQQDFAAGIKEIDMENAAEEDEENFDPDVDIRDYDEVAKSLPVFCVSSRAYQKLCGRFKKDGSVPGFKTLEETEIPQLQAHCKKLTEAGRIQSCRAFLLSLIQLLNTFSIWATDEGSGLKLSDEEKKAQVKYLNWRLTELEKGLEKAVEACIKMVKKDIEHQIFDKSPEVIEEAINAAPNTAAGWGAHRNDGGLFYPTYKATVRRDGVYSGAAGPRDFNAELVEPITKKLATGWERTFQTRLPKAFELYIRDSNTILRRFHDTVEERARENGVGLANLAMLKTQIYTYEQLFNELYNVLFTSMTELQRDANRDFTPVIVSAMRAAYDICTAESGTGCFRRMKAHMANHIEQARHHMFREAVESVRNHLNLMCKSLQKVMEDKADSIFVAMRHDYLNVLGGVKIDQAQVMSKEERALRGEIKQILMGLDERFRAVLDGTFVDTEESAGEAQTGPSDGADTDPSSGIREQMDVDEQPPSAANGQPFSAEQAAPSTPVQEQSPMQQQTPIPEQIQQLHGTSGISHDDNQEESQLEL
ncbi:uncharacterized protein EI97DRAFT_240440 [Westerdykella ornata]|uniref:P-loop containing nucleoside triphosphate hydrolase protein n=1 Tax=Westerdykella ornata TaxID=318751 RepID=A0A6A6J9L4_WESOR|nr:uncharacterized protein EI97DRAFT_240440 [Westerdykella ornata]KAF2271929.1 hypothetical protein EI97DRAFT_240440 [Westerdykella ornata]